MTPLRHAAVAGTFYPADAEALRTMIRGFLHDISAAGPVPKAIIVPHAAYIYSGPIAASAYARLARGRGQIARVVLLGPSHWVPCRGVAVSTAAAFMTPLGRVAVEQPAIARLLTLPQVHVLDAAHAREHSLEVQLPFLQEVLGEVLLIPLAVGEASPAQVGEVLDLLWEAEETCIVVSSDLSHYHEYATAQRLDQATAWTIEALQPDQIGPQQACGCYAVNGLLHVARQRGLQVQTIDLRNSGDTAGPHDQVVGYGAWVFTQG